jgi:choice-of-anchor B domain-containing protein
MTKISALSVCILFVFMQYSGFSQQNMSLLANVTIDEDANDIWGWVAEDGTEYAILGARNSVRIYSLADPVAPVEVASIPGNASTWRDIKTHENFIYVIADRGNQGVLIIDMTNAPNTIDFEYQTPIVEQTITNRLEENFTIDSMQMADTLIIDTTFFTVEVMDTLTIELRTCHNLYIDDGHIFFAGCNGGSNYNGVLIFDIETDPKKPTLVGIESRDYAHDVYVNGNTMFASEINNGNLGIYDITDKSNPIFLSSTQTGFSFTHNAWTNDAGTTVYTTDERANAYVEAYDISNLPTITMTDRFRPLASEGLRVVPHNTHYLNEFLYTSYYTDGIVVTDVSKPDNMIQVGQFDTWDGPDGGFNGNWGAYPFLPSGIILASDISSGLYVLQADIPRASYLEGTVIDRITGLPINGVDVQINSTDINQAQSDAAGGYKTGQATAGTFEVLFSHPNYLTQAVQINLESGQCTNLNVELDQARMLSLQFNTSDAATNEPIANTQIRLVNNSNDFILQANANGEVNDVVVEGMYTVYAGKWGYQAIAIENFNLNENRQLDIQLEEGFVDEFIVDLGWRSSGNATTGQWELAVPVGTSFGELLSNVNQDLEGDLGNSCYVTGNGGGAAGDDDVDDGIARLTSPITDLTAMDNPMLTYSSWFFNEGGNTDLDDTLKIYIQRGSDMILLETVTGLENQGGSWNTSNEVTLTDLFTSMDSLQFVFETSDLDEGHIVEAGLDGFSITDASTTPTDDFSILNDFILFPNPAKEQVTLELPTGLDLTKWNVTINDLNGRNLNQQIDLMDNNGMDVSRLHSGQYIITLTHKTTTEKLISKLVKI